MRGAEGGAQGLITVDDSESYFNEPVKMRIRSINQPIPHNPQVKSHMIPVPIFPT